MQNNGTVSPLYPWDSTSMDSINWGCKIFGGEITQSSKRQNLNSPHLEYHVKTSQTKWCIGFVLSIISNLDVIYSMWENVHRLCANTTPFCIRDLSIRGWSWNKSPPDTEELPYIFHSYIHMLQTHTHRDENDRHQTQGDVASETGKIRSGLRRDTQLYWYSTLLFSKNRKQIWQNVRMWRSWEVGGIRNYALYTCVCLNSL